MKSKSRNGYCCSIIPVYARGKSASRFCIFPEVESTCNSPSSAPVYLNVYDLTPNNGYVYWAGFGVFHTGVEVHGVEYAFGAHEYSSSGVFEIEPKQCPGFKYRRSILIGTTYMDPYQVREFMELQSLCYAGNTYNLIRRNCNHFCEDICYSLTGKHIPNWVNRLARIGSFCNVILPESLKSSTVGGQGADSGCYGNEKKIGSLFSCLSFLSTNGGKTEESISSELLRLSPAPEPEPEPEPELKTCRCGSVKEAILTKSLA